MYTNNNTEPIEILSDDEDENEARLTCSLRWLINKAYPDGTKPNYLPNEHFFQTESDERFLSPDIALVLLSGDLYIRAFQTITHQQDQFLTYEDLKNYFSENDVQIDFEALKQDDPLNAQVHLELIENLMKIYGKFIVDQNLIYQRFEKLHIKSVEPLKNSSTRLDLESLFVIWLNGIAEYMADQWTQRIPPVIDLRTSFIDGNSICALVSFYDENFRSNKNRNDLKFLRNFLNHLNGQKMTNLFPFTVKHLKENLIPDLNLQAMLVDLFFVYEIQRNHSENSFEDEENQSLNRSNQTYSLNGDEEDDDDDVDIEEFFINNKQSKSFEAGAVLQSTNNQPFKSSLKTSLSTSTIPKKTTSFQSPTTTTWQRQAASQTTVTTPSDRTSFDDSQFLAIKVQLEMKKRSIEREKQRLEKIRDDKRQTISQQAFKQLLQQKTRTAAKLNEEYLTSNESSPSIRKSQTTTGFSTPSPRSISENKIQPSSIVDLSKPMNRDEFLQTLEILKQKYIENNPSSTVAPQEQRHDEDRRIEQLNHNIGELQQVLTSLSVKQEEIHNQVTQANKVPVVSRHATFSTKSITIPRRSSNTVIVEDETEIENHFDEYPKSKTNGFVLDLTDDPSASTAIEMERKRELVLQRQQQRQEAYERRRQTREIEMNKRDDERRRKDQEDSMKKLEREQRRDEIYRQYLMKKEKHNPQNHDHENEHPIVKMRPKTTNTKPTIERRQTGPITISPFGTPSSNGHTTEFILEPDLNETITTTPPSLSFIRMAELRTNKTPSSASKIDSRTLPRPSARQNPTEPAAPLIPIAEPRYPLAKPLSGKSNKQTIVNALSQVILAGRVNDRHREQVCDEIERHIDKVKHFIILFRDSRLQFRSIYAFIPSTNPDLPSRLERLCGQGPREISEAMVDKFYKYNNGSKQFSPVPIKSFSVQCDAITIGNQHWSQSATKRTTQTSSTNPSDANLS